jgi:hypothetical protein
MTRRLIAAILTTGCAVALAWFLPAAVDVAARQNAQGGAAPSTPPAGPVPRLADGRPDLSGVWWGGADVGAARGRGARGGGRGAGGARGTPPPTFMSLYKPEVAAKAKQLGDKDDPTLRCIPTAFGTLNVSLWDVGAVGQIVATPKMVVMLTETYHGFRIIPTDGRAHRDDMPPAYRGDSVGRWDGDTFVVDTRNFTDNTWMSAEGRVSPHSDQLHIVERYRRVDANTLEIEATVEDPEVLTAPWTAPKQTLVLAPFDRILSLNCSGIETQALMDAAAKQGTGK